MDIVANGHSAALSSSETVAVPDALRPRLQALIDAHAKAKGDLSIFYQSLMVVLGLPVGTDWDLDSDTMILTPHVRGQGPDTATPS